MSEKKMIGENQKKNVFKKNTAWRLFFLPLFKIQVGEA